MDSRQALEHRTALVEPSVSRRGLQHRVLPADVIRRRRVTERLFDATDDVQVRQRRLHHHDVSALGEILLDFPERLASVGRIHLMRSAIAEARRGSGSVAKGSVQRRPVLGRVRHDGDVVEATLVERLADCADAAVHHVGWRDDVGTCGGVRDGGANKLIHRRIVHDLIVPDDAAVAMVGVFAQTDVGHHEDARQFAFERAHGILHGRFRVVGGRSDVVFMIGEPEEEDASNAVGLRRSGFFHRFIDRELADAGHRRNFSAHAFAFADKERQDEHVG